MGTLGPIAGWPVFVGLSLISSNMWALKAGERENTGNLRRILFAGIFIIIIASVVLGYANSLESIFKK